ncbi:MAG: serine/threonine-protein kinase [Actinobacteria bacterium]|nr:serine/threonine-protein kinase [Actinomycetota bacterium]
MHRDFKSANVLLHNGVAKIADLGFAKILQGPKTGTVLGTCLTMAPEVLEHKPYGFECDVWSLGVVFYEMVIGMYPFSAVNDMEVLRKIRKGPPNFPQQVPISNNCKDFILQCLTVDPRKRISWKAIYEHPLFQQAKVSMIRNVNTTFDINESLEFYKNYQPK